MVDLLLQVDPVLVAILAVPQQQFSELALIPL
jgi:hypothetical protein